MEEYTSIRLPTLEEYAHNFILSDIVPWHISPISQLSCVVLVDTRRSYPDLVMLTIQTVFQDADLFPPRRQEFTRFSDEFPSWASDWSLPLPFVWDLTSVLRLEIYKTVNMSINILE
jgi:hypothetical protein